jgi:predicted 2-oxoglutarate/Fe(II)-dependent dioxygenase YbiX
MPNNAAQNPRICVAYASSSGRARPFSPKECDAVIRWAEGNGLKAVRLDRPEDPAAPKTALRRHRQLNIPQPVSGEIAWFSNRLNDLIVSLNEQIWRFALTGISSIMIVKYEPGDHVARHIDLAADQPDRKLVLLVQLSAPDAYTGGALEYGVASPLSASREQGAVLAFPAWTPHSVAPLLSGIRYAAVCLGLGPSFR